MDGRLAAGGGPLPETCQVGVLDLELESPAGDEDLDARRPRVREAGRPAGRSGARPVRGRGAAAPDPGAAAAASTGRAAVGRGVGAAAASAGSIAGRRRGP